MHDSKDAGAEAEECMTGRVLDMRMHDRRGARHEECTTGGIQGMINA